MRLIYIKKAPDFSDASIVEERIAKSYRFIGDLQLIEDVMQFLEPK